MNDKDNFNDETDAENSFNGEQSEKDKQHNADTSESNKISLSKEKSTEVNEEKPSQTYDNLENIFESEEKPSGFKRFQEWLKEDDGKGLLSKKKRGTLSFICVVIFGIIMYFVAFRGGFITPERFGYKEPVKPITYYKDGQIFINDTNKDNNIALSSNAGYEPSFLYGMYAFGASSSEDGKIVYYLENLNEYGIGDLYKYDVSKDTSEKVSESVAYYNISKDGNAAIYFKYKDNTSYDGDLYIYDVNGEKLIDNNIVYFERGSGISDDGKFVYYLKSHENEYGYALYVYDGNENKLISEKPSNFFEGGEGIFFLENDEASAFSTLYEYSFENGEKWISDGVLDAYNINDSKNIYYFTGGKENIKLSDIIEDDAAEKDLSIQSPEVLFEDSQSVSQEEYQEAYNNYEAKELRDTIREVAKDDVRGVVTNSVYVYVDGNVRKLSDNVATLSILGDDASFAILNIPAKEQNIPKIKLSEISSFDDFDLKISEYQSQLKLETYTLRPDAEPVKLEYSDVPAYMSKISADNRMVFFYKDSNNGQFPGTLVLSGLDEIGCRYFAELDDNVQSEQFSGKGNDFAYLRDVESNSGVLEYVQNNIKTVVSEKCYGFSFGFDNRFLYYIEDYNEQKKSGTLKLFDYAGKSHDIDTNVYFMNYIGSDKMIYIKDYDENTGLGDLYLLDGKKSRLIDSGISAIYMSE